MNNSLSRRILLSILGLALLVVAFFGVSYAVFTNGFDSKQVNVINTGTISVSFSETTDGVSVSNAMSVSDLEGKLLVGDNNVFDFSVNFSIPANTKISYEMVAEKVDSTDIVLDDSNVRFYLEKLVNEKYVSTPITEEPKSFTPNVFASEFGSPIGAMTLYDGSFQNTDVQKKNFTDSYRLRMCISQDAEIDDISRNFQIIIKVYGKVL